MSEEETIDTAISHGFDSGNFDNAYSGAYFEECLEEAIEALDCDQFADFTEKAVKAFKTAYTLGWFSSYELHEMGEHEETYTEALNSEYGKLCIEKGLVDDFE